MRQLNPRRKVDCQDVYTTKFLPRVEVPKSML